jgi:isopropylmalate/homocitrate/citramalate synthase
MDGDTLVLGFASQVVKEKMEKEENLDIIRDLIKQILQKNVKVRCTVERASRNQVPSNVDDNGMVAAALRDLGGEIVDVQ